MCEATFVKNGTFILCEVAKEVDCTANTSLPGLIGYNVL